MSVANAGIAAGATSIQAEDAMNSNLPLRRGSIQDVETTYNVPSDAIDSDHPVAPDQFNPAFESTRKEIWSYYCYYIGNNGLTLFNFGPSAFHTQCRCSKLTIVQHHLPRPPLSPSRRLRDP
jgi:hypothetical protein